MVRHPIDGSPRAIVLKLIYSYLAQHLAVPVRPLNRNRNLVNTLRSKNPGKSNPIARIFKKTIYL